MAAPELAVQCLECRTENLAGAKFCRECGARLIFACPHCQREIPPDSKFCQECGGSLQKPENPAPAPQPLESALPPSLVEEYLPEHISEISERKYVTALFTDLSGYTTISEKLDPEEVKDLMSRIFGQIVKIVTKYEGYVEKFIGDAVMAVFGVPEAHEDDPVRAVWAAREIHELVEGISPEVEARIGRPLAMHTGINTGLVVTGEVDFEAGSQGVLGDTVNVASRLNSLAKAGEILVGDSTYQLSQGYFHFEPLEPVAIKGKTGLFQVYKVLYPRELPQKIRRLSGVRADLIGRKAEMELLAEAVERLREGKGSIIAISGEPGTGKSRLIEEFKASLNLSAMQWREGHCYSYNQKIPYFLLIDLLNRAWQIKEGDSPEKLRKTIDASVTELAKTREDIVPYVGSLYSLSYPELEGITPEGWKLRLQEAILTILAGLSRRAPTIICVEDLHWADPSSVDLIRLVLSESRDPTLFIMAYRPPFSLFSRHEVRSLRKPYREILLEDLSRTESQELVQSLLGTRNIPSQLKMFVQEIAGGNPFYLEELINALIESGILVFEPDSWSLSRAIQKSDIPPSIQEVISDRLDRLEKPAKRILQEASVIGKAFHYEVLEQVTTLKQHLKPCLSTLERLDLIRISSIKPDLEYVFKHAMIHEVVYNGLLKSERRAIHERIGLVMEELFKNRISEFAETLAFHFKQGESDVKAVDYLIESGEKSLERYALDEAHGYFKEAFDILSSKSNRVRLENELLLDLISQWFLVYYYRGDFAGMVDLLLSHRELAESLGDEARLGMHYACLAFSLYFGQEKVREAHELLLKAFDLGNKINNEKVMGYSAAWLAWVCGDLGLFDQGLHFGRTAHGIAEHLPSDQYLYFKSMAGIAFNYWQTGEGKKVIKIGKSLLLYGRRHANVRAMLAGHCVEAAGHLIGGDFPVAIKCAKEGIELAADPFYDQWAKWSLSINYVFQSIRFAESEELLEEVLSYSGGFGCNYLKSIANMVMGALLIAKGQMSRGLKMMGEVRSSFLKNERRYFLAVTEFILGRIYLQIAEGGKSVGIASIMKNLPFLIRNVPFAAKKAEHHLLQAIEITKKLGSKGILGQASLDLGLLQKKKGKYGQARNLMEDAIGLFRECEAHVFLKIAEEELQSLEEIT